MHSSFKQELGLMFCLGAHSQVAVSKNLSVMLSEDLLYKLITFLYNRNNQLETIIKKKIMFIGLPKLQAK